VFYLKVDGGINEQKKYLLRGLVEKAIAYDRGKFEIHYKLPDSTVLSNWLKNATDGEVNSLFVNLLVPSVCNQERALPNVADCKRMGKRNNNVNSRV